MDITLTTDNDWQQLLHAAESGDADAQLEVAIQYGSGIVINGVATTQEDEKLRYEWTKRAYDNGCSDAVVLYADYLRNGIHCTKDTARAIKLYKKEIRSGSSHAAHSLGIEYKNQHKFQKAFSLYKKAHKKSDPDFSVGLCYYYGVGVPQNKSKAFRFFKNTLKDLFNLSGYETNEANYLIGKMYLDGEGVKQSITKARHYLSLANEDGDHYTAGAILEIIGSK